MATRRRRKPKDLTVKQRLRGALRSKTIQVAILLAFLSALQGFVLAIPIDPLQQAAIGFSIAIIMILLRAVTKVPLDDL